MYASARLLPPPNDSPRCADSSTFHRIKMIVTAELWGCAVAQLHSSSALYQLAPTGTLRFLWSRMAEVLAIIGLVSNILSFIDFGLKFVSGSRNVRDSLYGTTTEIRELELIVEHIESHHGQVQRQQSSGQQLSADERGILSMVQHCRQIGEELHKAIGRLHVREGRSKALETSRVLFQGLWNQRDLVSLQTRLEALDKRIRLHIKFVIQRYVSTKYWGFPGCFYQRSRSTHYDLLDIQ